MSITLSHNLSALLGIVAGLLITELVAQAYLHFTGEPAPATPSPEQRMISEAESRLPQVNPYWGKSTAPGSAAIGAGTKKRVQRMLVTATEMPTWTHMRINNFGFSSALDYPQPHADPEQVFIAVFGGSVAKWFTLFATDELIAQLRSDPRFAGKTITVLNFASGGFKQPQQLLILNYFLYIGQAIDIVLNIDGYNEAALSRTNNLDKGIDISMPRRYPGSLKTLLSNPEPAVVLWRAKKIRLARQLAALNSSQQLHHSALLQLVDRVRANWIGRELDDHMRQVPQYKPGEDSGFFVLPPNRDMTIDEQNRAILDQWIRASQMMRLLTQQAGARYLHILQPNQYFSAHTFSPPERRAALAPTFPAAKVIRELYPLMLERLDAEARLGLPIFSGLKIFDQEPQAVYADKCCHYTDVGNRLLAQFVAGLILNDSPAAPNTVNTAGIP